MLKSLDDKILSLLKTSTVTSLVKKMIRTSLSNFTEKRKINVYRILVKEKKKIQSLKKKELRIISKYELVLSRASKGKSS